MIVDIHERGSGVPEALANDFEVEVRFKKLRIDLCGENK